MDDGKYCGYTDWTMNPTQIESAILRKGGEELVIEFFHDDYRYTTTLTQRAPSEYAGTFEKRQGYGRSEGRVQCTLFESKDELLLLGQWIEGPSTYHWWAKLQTLGT